MGREGEGTRGEERENGMTGESGSVSFHLQHNTTQHKAT